MGRRTGTVEPRVRVAVSPAMARLRAMQRELNGFWQITDLACGYMLKGLADHAGDTSVPTVDVLGHIPSEVWFPSSQGRLKRTGSIGHTLAEVRGTTRFACRATLLSFYSAFEAFLDGEAGGLKPAKLPWGPFVRSLSGPALRDPPCPIPLRTLLCADLCREVRNRMVHESFAVPTQRGEACVAAWRKRLGEAARAAGWPTPQVEDDLDAALHQVVGQAVLHLAQARDAGKDPPIELFYMLFTFTNLDHLAFAIEEALLPPHSRPGPVITRRRDAVRRPDLIVDSRGPAPRRAAATGDAW